MARNARAYVESLPDEKKAILFVGFDDAARGKVRLTSSANAQPSGGRWIDYYDSINSDDEPTEDTAKKLSKLEDSNLYWYGVLLYEMINDAGRANREPYNDSESFGRWVMEGGDEGSAVDDIASAGGEILGMVADLLTDDE